MMSNQYLSVVLKKNATLSDFALRCARAMDVCASIEHLPLDEPIPPFTVDDERFVGEIAAQRARIDRLEHMSLEEAGREAACQHANVCTSIVEMNKRTREALAEYTSMREKVAAWNPHATHMGLRGFMLQQLDAAIERSVIMELPTLLTPKAWLQDQLKDARAMLERFERQYELARAQANLSNEWIEQLRTSLKGL